MRQDARPSIDHRQMRSGSWQQDARNLAPSREGVSDVPCRRLKRGASSHSWQPSPVPCRTAPLATCPLSRVAAERAFPAAIRRGCRQFSENGRPSNRSSGRLPNGGRALPWRLDGGFGRPVRAARAPEALRGGRGGRDPARAARFADRIAPGPRREINGGLAEHPEGAAAALAARPDDRKVRAATSGGAGGIGQECRSASMSTGAIGFPPTVPPPPAAPDPMRHFRAESPPAREERFRVG